MGFKSITVYERRSNYHVAGMAGKVIYSSKKRGSLLVVNVGHYGLDGVLRELVVPKGDLDCIPPFLHKCGLDVSRACHRLGLAPPLPPSGATPVLSTDKDEVFDF